MSASSKSSNTLDPRLSNCISEIYSSLAGKKEIDALELVQMILKQHQEYGKQKAKLLRFTDSEHDMDKRFIEDWIADVSGLFDSKKAPKLHGRLVIIGLGLLKPGLRRQLQQNGFWDALVQELFEGPLEKILSPKQTAIYVPMFTDNELQTTQQDRLGRTTFARFLARRISSLSEKDGSYAINIYAPWGAGKSSLLNFMAEFLATEQLPTKGTRGKPRKWLVVKFNAWRHQHLPLPWWALLDTIYRQTRRNLNLWGRIAEKWWRIAAGRGLYLVIFFVTIVLAWLIVIILDKWEVTKDYDLLKNVSQITAVLLTLWGISSAVTRSLFRGSTPAAQNYVMSVRNSMNVIKKRFETLISRLQEKYRVAVFIDDLDRCRSDYVVELLEGIQTLFRGASVIYVVAADRRWLNACYEKVYESMKPWVTEPGKSLGTLFLEKTFQLSTAVPSIDAQTKKAYWNFLLKIRMDENNSKRGEIEKNIDEQLKTLATETEMLERLRQIPDPFEGEVLRRKIVESLAEPHIEAHTEHALQKFAPLLEGNPRSMKRLLNAYITNRALALLSHVDIDRDPLVLWTILILRWPQLAEALAQKPELVEQSEARKECPMALRQLLDAAAVKQVLSGNGISELPLDVEAVRSAALLWECR